MFCSNFLCKSLNAVCADYLVIFRELLIFFFFFFFLLLFFQKQASEDHLIQGNLLKAMLLNEKNKAVLKRKYVKISLYTPNIFHMGQEVMFTNKHTVAS